MVIKGPNGTAHVNEDSGHVWNLKFYPVGGRRRPQPKSVFRSFKGPGAKGVAITVGTQMAHGHVSGMTKR